MAPPAAIEYLDRASYEVCGGQEEVGSTENDLGGDSPFSAAHFDRNLSDLTWKDQHEMPELVTISVAVIAICLFVAICYFLYHCCSESCRMDLASSALSWSRQTRRSSPDPRTASNSSSTLDQTVMQWRPPSLRPSSPPAYEDLCLSEAAAEDGLPSYEEAMSDNFGVSTARVDDGDAAANEGRDDQEDDVCLHL